MTSVWYGLYRVLTQLSGTKQIFSAAPKAGDIPSLGAYKLIILDEADAMTSVAQMALRRIMEKYTANTRFCIIANYTHKLSPALLSRCTRFRFSPLKEPDIRQLVVIVIEKEDVKIQPEAVDSLVRLSKGDMRRALNVLQACHASSKAPFQFYGVCKYCHCFRENRSHGIQAHHYTSRDNPHPRTPNVK